MKKNVLPDYFQESSNEELRSAIGKVKEALKDPDSWGPQDMALICLWTAETAGRDLLMRDLAINDDWADILKGVLAIVTSDLSDAGDAPWPLAGIIAVAAITVWRSGVANGDLLACVLSSWVSCLGATIGATLGQTIQLHAMNEVPSDRAMEVFASVSEEAIYASR